MFVCMRVCVCLKEHFHYHMVGHPHCVFIKYIWLNQLSNTTNVDICLLPQISCVQQLIKPNIIFFICAMHIFCVMFQGTLESMMKCAEDQCPHVLADDRVQGEIRKMCREKNFLAPEFIHTCIVEQAGADIMNKFRLVCDRVGSQHKRHSEILLTWIYPHVLSYNLSHHTD